MEHPSASESCANMWPAHIDRVDLPLSEAERRQLRAQLCRLDDAKTLIAQIQSLYANAETKVAA